MKKKLFIGIDISKDTFDYVGIDDCANIILSNGVCINDMEPIRGFISTIKKYQKEYDVWVCLEHTGYYGLSLATSLANASITFSLLNPIEVKRSSTLVRVKNDKVDAKKIANYGLMNRHNLKPTQLPVKELQQLKAWHGMRAMYVKTLVQHKNYLRSLQVAAKSIDGLELIDFHKATIKEIERHIKDIEKKMQELINSNAELSTTYKKITSVVGVGPVVATACIIATENFTKFTKARKFACHCGVAPFENSSGTSIHRKAKTSKICDNKLKSILSQAACTAVQHDIQLKNYYRRKLNEGKSKSGTLNAVANKIILRIFAVAFRDQPYIKIAA